MKSTGSQERPKWSPNGLREQMEPHFQNSRSYSRKSHKGSSGRDNNPKRRERSDGGLIVEDISGLDTGYDADAEVVNPYRYEDADSDSNTPPNIPAKSNTDFDELWKHGIVDSMKSLDCSSGKDDSSARMPYKRGVKRKPKDTAEKLRVNEVHPSQGSPFEVVEINGGFSPKKPRRSKRLEVQDGDVHSAATTAPSDESSSVQPLSTDGSRGSSVPEDAMDIDHSTP